MGGKVFVRGFLGLVGGHFSEKMRGFAAPFKVSVALQRPIWGAMYNPDAIDGMGAERAAVSPDWR
jgi:hypothetical protein